MRDMIGRLLRYFEPSLFAARVRRFIADRRDSNLRQVLEECYRQHRSVFAEDGKRVILCEGMWDNPNHFFRLYMMLAAMSDTRECRLIGILRSQDGVKQRRSLESLGAKEFIYLENHPLRREQYIGKAQQLLQGVRAYRDLLRLELPDSLPAYVFYDTVLKIARHPQPPLNSPLWATVLADVFRNLAIYEDVFQKHEVVRVVSSHPWKNEYATLCWTALVHAVPFYYITGFCESTRIRRFITLEDFETPVDHGSAAEFDALSFSIQQRLINRGRAYLAERELGISSDINARYAFRPEKRQMSRAAARRALGVDESRPLAAVYAPVWFDFPHTFGMQHFTDFLDWMQFTVEQLSNNTFVTWLLKPHPCDSWYGGTRLADLVQELPPHVHLCQEETDSLTVQIAADYVVTVHGTVAIEAVARGLPVLCADRSYYSDWDFTYLAKSREDYAELLARVQMLSPPTKEQQRRAMACAALSLAPISEGRKLLRTSCDTTGTMLYEEIFSRFHHEKAGLSREIEAIREWMASGHPSYAAYHTRLYYER